MNWYYSLGHKYLHHIKLCLYQTKYVINLKWNIAERCRRFKNKNMKETLIRTIFPKQGHFFFTRANLSKENQTKLTELLD